MTELPTPPPFNVTDRHGNYYTELFTDISLNHVIASDDRSGLSFIIPLTSDSPRASQRSPLGRLIDDWIGNQKAAYAKDYGLDPDIQLGYAWQHIPEHQLHVISYCYRRSNFAPLFINIGSAEQDGQAYTTLGHLADALELTVTLRLARHIPQQTATTSHRLDAGTGESSTD